MANKFKGDFEEVLEKAVKSFPKDHGFKSHVAWCKYINEKDAVVDITNVYCHAGLQNEVKGKPKAVLSSIQKLRVNEGIGRTFIEWLINHSPYQSTFISKDAKKTFDDGVLVFKTDVPSNLLAGGAFASRAITEYARIAKVWHGLVEAGCNPDVAFMYSHYFTNGDGVYGTGAENNLGINPIAGHTAINGGAVNDSSVINFATGNRADQALYVNTARYSNVQATWDKRNPAAGKLTVFKGIPKVLADIGKGEKPAKNLNPFAIAADVEPIKVPFKTAVKELAAYFNDGYKGAIA